MKFSAVSLLVLGAGAAQHAGATPIRVIISEITNLGDSNSHVAHIDASHLLMAPPTFIHAEANQDKEPKAHRKPCAGARMREKGVALSNAFRQALGLPLIEKNISPADAERMVHGGLIRLMPNHHVGDDDIEGKKGRKGMWHHIGDDQKSHHEHDGDVLEHEQKWHHEHDGKMQKHHAHHVRPHGHGHPQPFSHRLHRALMTLGPWEGRAVAFVVGCGLGVLLRMLWVLSVVFVRAIKGGNNDDEVEYREIVLITDEEVVVAPPHYEYVDEKAPLEDVKTVAV